MNSQRAGLLGAFLLGVLLTVGVYEVTRMVVNARQAIGAAARIAEPGPEPEAQTPAPVLEKKRPVKSKASRGKKGKRRGRRVVQPKGPDRVVPPKRRAKSSKLMKPLRPARDLPVALPGALDPKPVDPSSGAEKPDTGE